MGMLTVAIALAMTPAPPACRITVSFGSFAMGIDRAAAARIERFLADRHDVASMERRPWGREGEYSLCIRLKPAADAPALYAQLKRLVPKEGRGPIEVRMADATR